jgi:DNA-binding NtrC family response regulator
MHNILIVDDEQQVLDVLQKLMAKLGYGCYPINNWEDASLKMDDEDFDLVMLDIHMPGQDGLQIAKEIRSRYPKQKIIIMTGLDPHTVFEKAQELDADFNEIVYKPFNFYQISQILSRLLA